VRPLPMGEGRTHRAAATAAERIETIVTGLDSTFMIITAEEAAALKSVIDYLQPEKTHLEECETLLAPENHIATSLNALENLYQRMPESYHPCSRVTTAVAVNLQPHTVATLALQAGRHITVEDAARLLDEKKDAIRDAMFTTADAVIAEFVREIPDEADEADAPAKAFGDKKEWNYFEVTFESDNPAYAFDYGFDANPPAHVRAHDEAEIKASLSSWFPAEDVEIESITPIGK
jgi:hypothetical protein